jgi:hypothetical protein
LIVFLAKYFLFGLELMLWDSSCRDKTGIKGLLFYYIHPFLEFQGAFKKRYSTTSNDVSHLMQASFLVDPTFKTYLEASTCFTLSQNDNPNNKSNSTLFIKGQRGWL